MLSSLEKKACIAVGLSLLSSSWAMAQSVQDNGQSLHVLIVDKETNQPISGAIVLTDYQQLSSDKNGKADISTLRLTPSAQIQVRRSGYTPYYARLGSMRLVNGVCRIALIMDSRLLQNVEIVARRKPASSNHIQTHVQTEKIKSSVGSSLANILEGIGGVSMVKSGTTVAKPVIQGMYGNRILLVNNGVRQSGQQWGDDHAPEVDMDSNNEVYVIKGAEAVRYGAEALGGVITVDNPLKHDGRVFAGELGSLYATNGRRTSTTLKLRGNHWHHLAWQIQGSYTHAGDQSTAHYLLNNTGVREQNIALKLGWEHENYGIEALYSRYDNKTGILPSSGLKNQDEMYEYLRLGQPTVFSPFSRSIDYPYHRVVHNLASLKAHYTNQGWGNLYFQGSYQYDEREEYNIRRNNHSAYPTLSLHLSSLQTEVRWEKDYRGWQTTAGVHYEQTNNYNLPGTGIEPLIPNYVDQTIGAYAIQKYQAGRWGAEAGLRLDYRTLTAAGIRYGKEYGGDNRYTNLTYTVGGHYLLGDGFRLTSNIGLAWRAPHVHELYSQGNEHGSGIYLVGKDDLKSEKSYKWITSLSKEWSNLRISLDGFVQWIPGYIYEEPSRELQSTLSGFYPIFRFKQSNAFFRGIDLDLHWQIVPRLTYKLTGSMIWANEQKTGQYFPYIPPLRVDQEISYAFKIPQLEQATLSLKHRFVDKQRRFDPLTDLTDSPPAYQLLGLEAHAGWKMAERWPIDLYLSAENLLNKEYKEYTNRARYYAHDAGRNIRLTLRIGF